MAKSPSPPTAPPPVAAPQVAVPQVAAPPVAAPPFDLDEPPIVDTTGRACKRCGSRPPAGTCADCGGPGATFESATWDHVHLALIDGKQTKAAVKRALCVECYRRDFKARYPNEPVPV